MSNTPARCWQRLGRRLSKVALTNRMQLPPEPQLPRLQLTEGRLPSSGPLPELQHLQETDIYLMHPTDPGSNSISPLITPRVAPITDAGSQAAHVVCKASQHPDAIAQRSEP